MGQPNSNKGQCSDLLPHPYGWYDKNGKHFLITNWSYYCYLGHIYFFCETDVPIHLFALVGTADPEFEMLIHRKRGVETHHDHRLDYPYHHVVCQDQAGDTIDHSFKFDFYQDIKFLWWTCLGVTTTPPQRWSPSRSPWFYGSCKPPVYSGQCVNHDMSPALFNFSDTRRYLTSFIPNTTFNCESMTLWVAKTPLGPPPGQVEVGITDTHDAGAHVGSVLAWGAVAPAWGAIGVQVPAPVSFAPITLQAGKCYLMYLNAYLPGQWPGTTMSYKRCNMGPCAACTWSCRYDYVAGAWLWGHTFVGGQQWEHEILGVEN